jgi:hypothetical protein
MFWGGIVFAGRVDVKLNTLEANRHSPSALHTTARLRISWDICNIGLRICDFKASCDSSPTDADVCLKV